jgi:hypothetical protein
MTAYLTEKTKRLIEGDRLEERALAISDRLTPEEKRASLINLFSTSAGSRESQIFQIGYLLHRWRDAEVNEPESNDLQVVFSPENIKLGYAVLIENAKSLPIAEKEAIGKMMKKLHKTEPMSDMVHRNNGKSTDSLFRPTNKFAEDDDYTMGMIGSLQRFSADYDEESPKYFIETQRDSGSMSLDSYLKAKRKTITDLFGYIDLLLAQEPQQYVNNMRALSAAFGYYSFIGTFRNSDDYPKALGLQKRLLEEFELLPGNTK